MDKYPRVLDLLQKAKKRLPHFASEYLFSGTGYDLAIKNNTEIIVTPNTFNRIIFKNARISKIRCDK